MSLFLYARGVGGGTLLITAVAMTFGVNFWNLGRIVAPGLGLIFTAAAVSALGRDARPPRLVDVLRGPRPRPWVAAVTVARSAYAALAAVWLALGLLNYLGVLRADPVLSILRWPALPLAAFAAAHTAFLTRVGGPAWGVLWSSSLRAAHLLAGAVMAGGGLLTVAAPFELVGAEVRHFLASSFIAATALHLLLAMRHVIRRPVGAGAGTAIHGRHVRLGWPSAVLAAVGAVLAGVVPGWAGPIAGALVGQFALLAYLTGYPACDPSAA